LPAFVAIDGYAEKALSSRNYFSTGLMAPAKVAALASE
jgi:hypothetical protein